MQQQNTSLSSWRRALAGFGLPFFGLVALMLLEGCSLLHFGAKQNPAAAVPASAPIHPAKVSTVVRPAPDFTWLASSGKAMPVKALRGQPLILIIAPSPDDRAFRKEVALIDRLYLNFSERKTVFLAAFSSQPGRVLSNVPYVIVQNGAAVAAAYGVPANGFGVVVISPEGNMDLISNHVEAAQRLLDMINNSYQPQAASRTGLGS